MGGRFSTPLPNAALANFYYHLWVAFKTEDLAPHFEIFDAGYEIETPFWVKVGDVLTDSELFVRKVPYSGGDDAPVFYIKRFS